MKHNANSIDEYIHSLPSERREAFEKLWNCVKSNLPEGFSEEMTYRMPGFVVPHSRYPQGYHVNPSLPLPFISVGSQKNYIALYHSAVYSDPKLLKWFQDQYPKHSKAKLDMGKSCIRFKNMNDIPYDLIGELSSRMTVDNWVSTYEEKRK